VNSRGAADSFAEQKRSAIRVHSRFFCIDPATWIPTDAGAEDPRGPPRRARGGSGAAPNCAFRVPRLHHLGGRRRRPSFGRRRTAPSRNAVARMRNK